MGCGTVLKPKSLLAMTQRLMQLQTSQMKVSSHCFHSNVTLNTCLTVSGTARTTPTDHMTGLFLIKRGPPDLPARHLAFTVPSAPVITTRSCQNNYICTRRPQCKYHGLLKRACIPKTQSRRCIGI